jgi:hypothetical protein
MGMRRKRIKSRVFPGPTETPPDPFPIPSLLPSPLLLPCFFYIIIVFDENLILFFGVYENLLSYFLNLSTHLFYNVC